MWPTFLLRQGCWLCSPVLCFVWVTEELLQPAKEMLPSHVWRGGPELGRLPLPHLLCASFSRGLCLRGSAPVLRGMGKDDGLNSSLFPSSSNQTLYQMPPPPFNALSYTSPTGENEVRVLHSCFVQTIILGRKGQQQQQPKQDPFVCPQIKAF